MIPEYFAIIGSIIASIGGLYYLYETLVGKSQPNRVTWVLWGIFPMITFAAQKAQGVDSVSWATFAAGFTPLLIFIASFVNKKAYWKTKAQDYILFAASAVAILLWALTDNANLAIAFALLADGLAAVPTVIKCFKHPETESWIAYAFGSAGFLLAILTIKDWTFESAAFVIYLFIVNTLMATFSSRKRANILHTEAE